MQTHVNYDAATHGPFLGAEGAPTPVKGMRVAYVSTMNNPTVPMPLDLGTVAEVNPDGSCVVSWDDGEDPDVPDSDTFSASGVWEFGAGVRACIVPS